MSVFGWDLPAGVTDKMIDDLCGEHVEDCPCHEDAEALCAECGLPELPHRIIPVSQLPHEFVENEDPDCTCSELITSNKAAAAEARYDAMHDR